MKFSKAYKFPAACLLSLKMFRSCVVISFWLNVQIRAVIIFSPYSPHVCDPERLNSRDSQFMAIKPQSQFIYKRKEVRCKSQQFACDANILSINESEYLSLFWALLTSPKQSLLVHFTFALCNIGKLRYTGACWFLVSCDERKIPSEIVAIFCMRA